MAPRSSVSRASSYLDAESCRCGKAHGRIARCLAPCRESQAPFGSQARNELRLLTLQPSFPEHRYLARQMCWVSGALYRRRFGSLVVQAAKLVVRSSLAPLLQTSASWRVSTRSAPMSASWRACGSGRLFRIELVRRARPTYCQTMDRGSLGRSGGPLASAKAGRCGWQARR